MLTFTIYAAKPNVIVTDSELKCVRDGYMSTHYLLNWTEPENIDKFDLDYYEVTVTISNGPLQMLHFSNTSAIISLGLPNSEVEIDVVAVSRCGERGPSNPRPITVEQCTTASYPECTSSSSTKPNFSMSVTIIVLMLLINIVYS